jgi:amidohydrolase
VKAAVLKDLICRLVDERSGEFIAIARELYEHPETGLYEHRASALLSDLLGGEGFSVERGLAGMETAFCASYGNDGPTVAILAEMDALPELGHGCGHNIIAAAAVGAAVALRHVLPAEVAKIVLFGTPAEELGIGKVELINAGLFDGVDFAMMVHPSSRRYVTKGYLGLARLRFVFHGKPAHAAAYPEEGINALDAVIQTFNGINALRQQVCQDVRIHGIITEGGVAPNIIPARAACSFYVRADELSGVRHAAERVIACAKGAAIATGATLDLEEDPRVLAPFRINRAFADLYSSQLALLGLPEDDVPVDRNRGSSDIGNVSQIVPTIHPHVPIGPGINIHSAEFARATVSPQGELAVLEGAKAMAMTAVDLVLNPEIRKKILDNDKNN